MKIERIETETLEKVERVSELGFLKKRVRFKGEKRRNLKFKKKKAEIDL